MDILENLLVQRQLRHQSLQLAVLLFQFFQPLRLVHLQTAVFLAPAVKRLHCDGGFFAGLWGGFSIRDADFNLPQHRYDLLWFVPLDGHDPLFLQLDSLSFHLVQISPVTSFHVAYYHATQQAFLEAHELGFSCFGGVFRCLRYDNLKSAVKKILRGHQREETERLIAFRSHWGFQTEFCNPARGNEKGGVEGEVGYFRRNHLVPVPQAKNLEELTEQLRSYCHQDEQRRIAGKPMPVGEAMRIEREHLLPLTAEGFELAEISFPTVDSKGCVKVRTNFYSTPLKPGTRPQAKLLPAYVEIWQERECVARHERSFGRYEQVLDLEHYLDVLEKKPGALAGSSPLRQWRERGRWPESFDRLWLSLQERHGKHPGSREMIELLALGKRHGWERLQQAVKTALALGCTDAAAVRHLLTATELERYERPLPQMNEYDQLLSIAAAATEVAR
jgi:hypothetical protein